MADAVRLVHRDRPTVVIDLTPLDTPTRAHGIGRYLKNLARGLDELAENERAGLQLVALTHLGWTGSYRVTDDLASFSGSPALERPTDADRYRWAYRRRVALWRALRILRPQLIHLGDPNATPLGMRLSGCARLVTCHDVIPLELPDRYFSWKDGFGLVGPRLVRRRFRSADHVVTISDATSAALERRVGISPSRITRIYNGVPIEQWSPEPTDDDDALLDRHGLEPRRFVLYVGNADWRKNVEGMLAALARARARGLDVTWVHAGRVDTSKRHRVQRIAAAHGVVPWVRSLGYCDDATLGALYRHALCNLFVSRAEGFGLPLVEAMACGCPCITTARGSLGEVAGNAAMPVDPEDAEAIAAAMIRLARDEPFREDLRQRGLERAPRFSVRAQAEAMIALYRKLVDPSAPPRA